MSWFLEEDDIECIFDIVIKYQDKLQDSPSIFSLYLNAIRNSIELTLLRNEEFVEDLLESDDLGMLDVDMSLNNIKQYYCNSFIEDNHIILLIFLSELLNSLGSYDEFDELINNLNRLLDKYNLLISKEYSDEPIAFIGELLGNLDSEEVVLNTLKMYDSFQQMEIIDMIKERLKDAIFLYANNRYTASLALMAFALEGFLRAIFGDNYEAYQEKYDHINASLKKTADGKNLMIEYNTRVKPSQDITIFPESNLNQLEIYLMKSREQKNNTIVELKIKNEYAGLLCLTEKKTITKPEKHRLETLIQSARDKKLIDEKNFFSQSFDFLRIVRNNIVHFKKEHIEITQKTKVNKIIRKILAFINSALYRYEAR